MNDSHEKRLTERLDQELRALPPLAAPRTLAPRVLAALAARRQAPWWTKAWSDWPAGFRGLFLALGVTVAGLLVIAGLQLQALPLGPGLAGALNGWLAELQPYAQMVGRLAEAIWQALKVVPPQLFWLCAAMIGLAYATCIGLGTLGYRLALNRI